MNIKYNVIKLVSSTVLNFLCITGPVFVTSPAFAQASESTISPATQLSNKSIREYADALFWGNEVTCNRGKAFETYKKAALSGDARSAAFLGRCLLNGYGSPKNFDEAEKFLLKSESIGDPMGTFYLAQLAEIQGDEAKANNLFSRCLKKLETEAKKGDHWCQNSLGYMYSNGKYLKKDSDLAFFWYEKSSQAGNPLAPLNISYEIEKRVGLQKDEAMVLKFLNIAANRGVEHAQIRLGDFYFNGTNGVSKDGVKAFNWYKKAAESDHVGAIISLGACYQGAIGVSRDESKAFHLFSSASSKGDPLGHLNVSVCYYTGKGVVKDLAKAGAYAERAALGGNLIGMRIFGYYRLYGVDGILNIESGKSWLKKAASLGDTESKDILNKYEQSLASRKPAQAESTSTTPKKGPTEEQVTNAVVSVVLAIVAHEAASQDPQDLGDIIAGELARALRDELISNALTNLFSDLPTQQLREAKNIISLAVDGKLTADNWASRKTLDAISARLNATSPQAAQNFELARFIGSVVDAYQKK